MRALSVVIRGPVGYAVEEALRAVLSPELCARVLTLALDHAGASTVPEEAGTARAFVEGPLRAALAHTVGHELAAFVQESLDPMLDMAASAIVPRGTMRHDAGVFSGGDAHPDEIPTEPPPPLTDAAPASVRLLVCTLDSHGADAMKGVLGARAEVLRIADVFELVSWLDRSRAERTYLIVDCRTDVIDPVMLGVLFPMVPSRCVFVIWGAHEARREALLAATAGASQWIFAPAELRADDVADMVGALL